MLAYCSSTDNNILVYDFIEVLPLMRARVIVFTFSGLMFNFHHIF